MMSTKSKHVLFYVQHLLGIGHVRRASLIATAIADAGIQCHVVLGGPPVSGIHWGDATTVQLPPIHAADQTFSRYLTAKGREPEEVDWSARLDVLFAAIDTIRPDAIVIEQFPFGRRKFRHEISSMIERTRSLNTDLKVIGSVRDVLVSSNNESKAQFACEILRRDFDALLVHGDQSFIKLDETFPLVDEIRELIHYTGYVAPPGPVKPAQNNEVIVSAGGGAVGASLMHIAMRARKQGLLSGHHWRFLTGPNLPEGEVSRLHKHAPTGVTVEPNRPDYPALLSGAALSISQAGYNTLMDLVRAECPAVVVPFTADDETEQTLRAKRLAELGAIELMEQAVLDPTSLSESAERAIRRDRLNQPPFKMNGDIQSAEMIVNFLKP